MSRARPYLIGVAVLVSVASTTRIAAQQTPQPSSFRATTDLVTVDTAVQRRGRPVLGLTAADFTVIDNGVPQHIVQVSYEALPIDVTVALDMSESISDPVLAALRQAIRDLSHDLAPQDRLRLVTFNVRVTTAFDFGGSHAALEAALADIHPFGGTAIFDAIATVLATPGAPDRRQLAIVFSDGEDHGSVTAPPVLLDVARRTRPTFALILPSARLRYGQNVNLDPTNAERARQKMYDGLARETGGFVKTIGRGDSLSDSFRRMLTEFRQTYVLYYAPANVTLEGAHTIEVRVKRDGVDVRARRGYVR